MSEEDISKLLASALGEAAHRKFDLMKLRRCGHPFNGLPPERDCTFCVAAYRLYSANKIVAEIEHAQGVSVGKRPPARGSQSRQRRNVRR